MLVFFDKSCSWIRRMQSRNSRKFLRKKFWSSSRGKLTPKSCFTSRKTPTTMVVMETFIYEHCARTLFSFFLWSACLTVTFKFTPGSMAIVIETVARSDHLIYLLHGQSIVKHILSISLLSLFWVFNLLHQVEELFVLNEIHYVTIYINSSSQKLHNLLRNRISSLRILSMARPSLEAGLIRWVNLQKASAKP